VDPRTYRPRRNGPAAEAPSSIAIVGSGPAGLTAAHYLSLVGHQVTVFEADDRPGGMLVSGIPAYRLPRETLKREIEALLDENVTLKCGVALGRDFSIDALLEDGFDAVYLALGAHKSRRLNLEGEDIEGVQPAISFLKDFNLRGESRARGHVGVIGGGDSAVDAAGIALRQDGVESVTIFYRRTREEMPAQQPDIDGVIEEGVTLHTLVSPVRILTDAGRPRGVECIRNRLGSIDSSGRRRPEPVDGTEFTTPLDTLIVTIGDVPDIDFITSMGIDVNDWGTIRVDEETLMTSRPGVFAGGDVVTGPNTVVDAIAAGKRAATMIGRYLRDEDLVRPAAVCLPDVFVDPVPTEADELENGLRAEPPVLPAATRCRAFDEVAQSLTEEDAKREARRCLRCDLDFTRPRRAERTVPMTVGASA
jgi:NADH-quinone oxidoreductase subunit F